MLQKKQREILNNINNNLGQVSESGKEESEMESTDAEVSSLLSSNPSVFKAMPRISPVLEDESQPVSQFQCSPLSSRSVASPFGDFVGSHGSSSSSLLDDGRGGYLAPTPYNPSPPRHGKLRPVGRTQSAPLPLAHPGLLAPPEVRQGKTSPELESLTSGTSSSIVKQQIRHSVLTRHHQHHRVPPPSLDPMSAIAELSQMQTKCFPAEETPSKVRHSSTENISRGRPKPISRTRSSPLVSLSTSISPTAGNSKKTGVAWDPVMLKHHCLCGDDSSHPESPARLERIMSCLAESGGLLNRCELVKRSATLEELMSTHSHQHVHLYGEEKENELNVDYELSPGVSPLLRGTGGLSVNRLPCGGWGVDNDTVWNDIHTPSAAKVAAGSIIELVNKGCGVRLR